MRRYLGFVGVVGVFLSLVACSTAPEGRDAVSESERLNAFFDRTYDDAVLRYPEWQTYQGIKTDYDQWNDWSEARQLQELEITKSNLAWVTESIDPERLDAQSHISYRMALDDYADHIDNFRFRYHNYPISQMFGRHSSIPSFLINVHLVTDVSDAAAYIARLRGVDRVVDQLIEQLERREAIGVVLPKHLFPKVLETSRNVLVGEPFDDSGKPCVLLNDFEQKVQALELEVPERDRLVAEADAALREVFLPAYMRLIAFLEGQQERADEGVGVWRFDDGDAYYNQLLRQTTTTELSADEIHRIGLEEVARIQGEMQTLMREIGFSGTLSAFFDFMRTDKQFYFSNDEAGKQAYLDETTRVLDTMRGRLDEFFTIQPEAELVVKPVEAYREKSAAEAFYSPPAPDGSRPGTYYVNLGNMENAPRYKIGVLAYHEAIPGHHMQIALAQQLEALPKFRRFGGYTAYAEGWALYSELLPYEIGLYTDPYSNFGRLMFELYRACRLVVDTGIHAKRWTREQAIAYYRTHSAELEANCIRMVDRHIVLPAQATAYKVGMLKLLELRSRAQAELGERFDLREFHDVVLVNGPVPLDILEQLVEEYIVRRRA